MLSHRLITARLRRLFDDVNYLHVIDRSEQQLAKLLGLVLMVVMVGILVSVLMEAEAEAAVLDMYSLLELVLVMVVLVDVMV